MRGAFSTSEHRPSVDDRERCRQVSHAGDKNISSLSGTTDRKASGHDAAEVGAVVHIGRAGGIHIAEFNRLCHGIGRNRKGAGAGIDACAIRVERIGKEAEVAIGGRHRLAAFKVIVGASTVMLAPPAELATVLSNCTVPAGLESVVA